MRDKRSDTRFTFKLNYKEITLFIVGSVGVISLFFIIGIWIGKSLNAIPNELIRNEYMPESDIPSPRETEVDITKDDDTSYEFQDTLGNEKTIPLKDNDNKIKIIYTDDAKAAKANKIKSQIDNFSVTKSDKKVTSKPAVKPEPKEKPKAAIKPRPKPKKIPREKGRYTVQIASLKSDKAAVKLKTRLEKQGYDAYFVATNIKGKGVWYRVRVGNYTTKAAATKAIKSLEKKIKMKGMIVRDSRN